MIKALADDVIYIDEKINLMLQHQKSLSIDEQLVIQNLVIEVFEYYSILPYAVFATARSQASASLH